MHSYLIRFDANIRYVLILSFKFDTSVDIQNYLAVLLSFIQDSLAEWHNRQGRDPDHSPQPDVWEMGTRLQPHSTPRLLCDRLQCLAALPAERLNRFFGSLWRRDDPLDCPLWLKPG